MRIYPAVVLVAVLMGACGDPVGLNPDVVALELLPADTLVAVGDRVTLSVRMLDGAGTEVQPLENGTRPEWRVSDAGVAVVGSAGEVEAVGPGAALVTVAYGPLSAEARVRVNPSAVELRVASAYLVQSVQRGDGGVPLVADREAVLRVFVVADQPNFHRPPVTATIRIDGVPAGSFTMAAAGVGVPTEVRESELGYHARVPADLIRPGAELVVVVDPDGTVQTAPGSRLRYPQSGSMPLDVRAVPPFLLRVVPVRSTSHGTTGRIDSANADALARLTRDIYPLAEADVDVRSVYATDARLDTHEGWSQLVQEIYLLRAADGSNRYYYGAVELPTGTVTSGRSYGPVRASAGSDSDPAVLAHELGHNFYLPHAPCGTTAYDRSFPYPEGSIGHYGFNTRTMELVRPDAKDIMSYCGPRWISDHHYEKALRFREENDWDLAATPEPSLIVWGRIVDGELHLEPLLELPATPILPPTPTLRQPPRAYRIDGFDHTGGCLFSLAFDPTPIKGTGTAGFLFALPVRHARPERLARVQLSGPEGVVERTRAAAAEVEEGMSVMSADHRSPGVHLRWSSQRHPLVVVRDRRSGEVLALSRAGALDLAGYRVKDLVVSVSDGIRTRVVEPGAVPASAGCCR